jgi:hypothetical protein
MRKYNGKKRIHARKNATGGAVRAYPSLLGHTRGYPMLDGSDLFCGHTFGGRHIASLFPFEALNEPGFLRGGFGIGVSFQVYFAYRQMRRDGMTCVTILSQQRLDIRGIFDDDGRVGRGRRGIKLFFVVVVAPAPRQNYRHCDGHSYFHFFAFDELWIQPDIRFNPKKGKFNSFFGLKPMFDDGPKSFSGKNGRMQRYGIQQTLQGFESCFFALRQTQGGIQGDVSPESFQPFAMFFDEHPVFQRVFFDPFDAFRFGQQVAGHASGGMVDGMSRDRRRTHGFVPCRHTQPAQPILGGGKTTVFVKLDGVECRTTDKHPQNGKIISVQQFDRVGLFFFLPPSMDPFARRFADLESQMNKIGPSVLVNRFFGGLQVVGKGDVVGIEKIQVLSAGTGGPVISRRAPFPVFFPKINDARVAEGFDHRAGIVVSAVVHDDDLKIRKRLSQKTFQRFAYQPRPLISGNDDRKKRG